MWLYSFGVIAICKNRKKRVVGWSLNCVWRNELSKPITLSFISHENYRLDNVCCKKTFSFSISVLLTVQAKIIYHGYLLFPSKSSSLFTLSMHFDISPLHDFWKHYDNRRNEFLLLPCFLLHSIIILSYMYTDFSKFVLCLALFSWLLQRM